MFPENTENLQPNTINVQLWTIRDKCSMSVKAKYIISMPLIIFFFYMFMLDMARPAPTVSTGWSITNRPRHANTQIQIFVS